MDFEKTIQRRLTVIGVIVLIAVVVFLGRMFDLQITKHSHYIDLAEGQQRFQKTELPQRGRILVHDSLVEQDSYYSLAFDVKKFAVWVVPRNVKNKEKVSEELAGNLGLSKEDIYNQINNDKLYIPPIKRGLDLNQADDLDSKNIEGTFIMPEYSRYYPEGTLAAHLLGFVNAEGNGVYGFEGKYNNELQGTAGIIEGEKDTLGRIITLFQQKNPQNGTSYVLTIDRSVQYYVEKALNRAITDYQAESGSILIMDIKTGGMVAMASTPTYDPNNFREFASDQSIFINQAISGLYEPGSVLKPIIMSAAIDQGVITPETKNTFDWHVFVQGYEIKTAGRKAFGEQTMTQVLQNSDNVGMVWVSEQIGKNNLHTYLKAYNFFDKTGIDLGGEVAGYAPPLKNWQDINRSTIAFGQGISVTPIELLCAYATIANEGKYIYPRMVDKLLAPDGIEKKTEKMEGAQVIKPETAKTLTAMLTSVVQEGISYRRLRELLPGFEVAAKTGTAQISSADGGYLQNESGLGIFTHSMTGFAPANDPKFAMIVKLDKPKTSLYAESTAEPVFGDISSFLLNYYYRIAPTKPTQ